MYTLSSLCCYNNWLSHVVNELNVLHVYLQAQLSLVHDMLTMWYVVNDCLYAIIKFNIRGPISYYNQYNITYYI